MIPFGREIRRIQKEKGVLMIIDVHCHYLPESLVDVFEKSVEYADISRVLKMMDQNDINRAVLLFPGGENPKISGGWGRASEIFNDTLASLIREHGERFIGAALLPVDNPVQLSYELYRIKDLNIKMLSLLSSYRGVHLDDQRFRPVFDFARRYRMPVYVHPQTAFDLPMSFNDDLLIESAISPVFDMAVSVSKMIMSGVFLKYDDVNFIFGHAGTMMALLQKDLDEDYAYFRRSQKIKDVFIRPSEYLKNVFWETGGCTSVLGVKVLVELLDPRRILFGTNYPRGAKVQQMRTILEEALPDDNFRDMVLSHNLLKILPEFN